MIDHENIEKRPHTLDKSRFLRFDEHAARSCDAESKRLCDRAAPAVVYEQPGVRVRFCQHDSRSLAEVEGAPSPERLDLGVIDSPDRQPRRAVSKLIGDRFGRMNVK